MSRIFAAQRLRGRCSSAGHKISLAMSTNQADGAYTRPNNGGSGGNIFGKQLMLLALVCVAGFFTYKMFTANGGSILNLFQDPKEVKLTYVPADFQPNLDEEATLRILSDPAQYHREFDQLVYDFNVSLLYHVANRMALPDSLKRRLEPEYTKHHAYLKTMYYNDFTAIKDTTAGMYETWYKDNSNQAVEVFNEVAGKYTCFFVTQIMATLIKSNNGKYMAKGKDVETPCGLAINEGLRPMVDRLKKKADIIDFSASHGMLKDKVRRGITELATYELRSRLGLDKQLQYKVFGIPLSTTELRVEAISVIKAGFKLDDYFNISFNPKKGRVYVTLPPPTIVSHEVYPRVDKLDIGWLAGISGDEMNENFNALRRQFREDAIQNERILEKAKSRADSVMQLMLGPMVKGMSRGYKLEVRFQDVQDAPTADELRRRGEDPGKANQSPDAVIDGPKPTKKSKFVPQ
jgi:hypothetical protein